MKKHLIHAAAVVAAMVLAAIPAIVASPVVTNFVAAHPTYAVYFPVVTAALLALYRKYGKPPQT